MKEVLKYGLILMLVAAISAGALAIVSKATEGRRKQVLEGERRIALSEVLAEAKVFEPVTKGEEEILYYVGYDSDERKKVIGYAFVAEGKGYSSTIKTMVGITPNGTITGIKILSQQETPGLGARIEEVKTSRTLKDIFSGGPKQEKAIHEKPWFQAQFPAKKKEDLYPQKMDTITGATISSKAVIESVRGKIEEVLLLAGENK